MPCGQRQHTAPLRYRRPEFESRLEDVSQSPHLSLPPCFLSALFYPIIRKANMPKLNIKQVLLVNCKQNQYIL